MDTKSPLASSEIKGLVSEGCFCSSGIRGLIFWRAQFHFILNVILLDGLHGFTGLTLDEKSGDIVEGKVVGVSHDLYMKGCVQDVSEGIKVRNLC